MLIVRLDRGLDRGGVVNPRTQFHHATAMARRNNFMEFLNKTENGTEQGRFGYYIKNEMIVSKNLQGDFVKPGFITKVLRNRLTGLTIWPNFVRKPEFKDRERYYCVIQGKEEFRMVSPIYKQNIYSGVLEEYAPEETPLDFFNNVNRTQYPLFSKAKVLSSVLSAG